LERFLTRVAVEEFGFSVRLDGWSVQELKFIQENLAWNQHLDLDWLGIRQIFLNLANQLRLGFGLFHLNFFDVFDFGYLFDRNGFYRFRFLRFGFLLLFRLSILLGWRNDNVRPVYNIRLRIDLLDFLFLLLLAERLHESITVDLLELLIRMRVEEDSVFLVFLGPFGGVLSDFLMGGRHVRKIKLLTDVAGRFKLFIHADVWVMQQLHH
jgi:hypothetical protein